MVLKHCWLTKPSVTFETLLRKFVSLLVSIWYFENEFTAVHWLGTALVFGGTLVFSEVHHKKTAKRSIQPTEERIPPILSSLTAGQIPRIPSKVGQNQKSK